MRHRPKARTVVIAALIVVVGVVGNQDLLIASRDGSHMRTIAPGDAYEYAPSFAPNGQSVLFTRDGAIKRVDLATGAVEQITQGPSDANPALSRDGTRLAFVRAGSLFVAGADGQAAECVATGRGIGSGPRWRPITR